MTAASVVVVLVDWFSPPTCEHYNNLCLCALQQRHSSGAAAAAQQRSSSRGTAAAYSGAHGAQRRGTAVSLSMEANIVVLGTESVGKSGEKQEIHGCTVGGSCVVCLFLTVSLMLLCFSALTVRLLTRRFIGEYGDIGKFHTSLLKPL